MKETKKVLMRIITTEHINEAIAIKSITTEEFSGMFETMQAVWRDVVASLPIKTTLLIMHVFHSMMDAFVHMGIEQALKDHPDTIGCYKGCGLCCNIRVAIVNGENDTITRYVDKYSIKVANRVGYCPYLDEVNVCQIYPVRPAMCRKHFIMGGPRTCKESPGPVPFVAILPAELLWSVAATAYGCKVLFDPETLRDPLAE